MRPTPVRQPGSNVTTHIKTKEVNSTKKSNLKTALIAGAGGTIAGAAVTAALIYRGIINFVIDLFGNRL